MKENTDLYALIVSPNFESNVLDLCIAMSMEKMDEETKKYFIVKDGMDYQRRWDCCYGIYGCRGVAECWIRDGMKESPEQLADYYLARIRSLVGAGLTASYSNRYATQESLIFRDHMNQL